MTAAGLIAIGIIALPATAFVLWPFFRRGGAPAGLLPVQADRRDELTEEKSLLYRALRELEFDHQAGHLSNDDYAALRSRYESRAAQILNMLDALPPRKVERREATRERAAPEPRAWTRSPVTLIIGAVLLLVFGLILGLGVARYTEPDRTLVPPGSRLPVPMDAPGTAGMPGMPGVEAPDPARPVPPAILRGMLEAAHQSLDAGRYQEAIAAYRAVLKRDPKNVDAITHLGVILSIAGHDDNALEAFDKAIAIDPTYAHAYWDKARILYEVKQDYRGAIGAWEKFLALVPSGEDRDRAVRLIGEARSRLVKQGR